MGHLVKFVFVFIFFLAGFAFSFHIIFQEDKAAFSSPWESLLRTVSMLLGDLDYDGYMAGDKPTPLVGTAHLVYFIFLILVSLILMNLLIGLAVDDITGLQAEGQWRRLRHQANFIVYLENVASNRFLRWILPEKVAKLLIDKNGELLLDADQIDVDVEEVEDDEETT